MIRRRIAEALTFGLTLAFVFAVELLLLHYFYGVWIIRLILPPEATSSWSALPSSHFNPFSRLAEFWRLLYACNGWYLPLCVAGWAIYPFLRGRSWLLWGIYTWLGIYSLWGTTSFTSYSPMRLQARYFAFLVPLALVCAAHLIDQACGWVNRLSSVRVSRIRGRAVEAFAWTLALLLCANALHTSKRAAGFYARSDYGNELARVMDAALHGFDLPIVIANDGMIPMYLYGNKPDDRIHVVKPTIDLPEFRRLLGTEGALLVTYERQGNRIGSMRQWAERRIEQLPQGKVDLSAEAVMALHNGSELVQADSIGYYPMINNEGRLIRFLRTLGLRAGQRQGGASGTSGFVLYRLTPKTDPPAGSYGLHSIFSLTAALENAPLDQWISAPQSVLLNRTDQGVNVALEQAGKFYLTMPPGDWELTPPIPNPAMRFPLLHENGRQIVCRVRYRLDRKIANLILWVLQYDGEGRIQFEGIQRHLENTDIDSSAGEHEAVFHTILKPQARAVRLLITVQTADGVKLDLQSVDIEQLNIE